MCEDIALDFRRGGCYVNFELLKCDTVIPAPSTPYLVDIGWYNPIYADMLCAA